MNRITKGEALIGKLTVGTSETVASANIAALAIGGTSLDATSTEINNVADLSAIGAVQKVKRIALAGAGIGSTETDSGWALPTKCIVHDVLLDVTVGTTGGASETMHVGLLATTSGDADGFLAGVCSTGVGLVYGYLTATSSGQVASNWGAYLAPAVAVNTTAQIQMTDKKDLVLDSGTSSKNISYTYSSTTNDNFAGAILIRYTEIN